MANDKEPIPWYSGTAEGWAMMRDRIEKMNIEELTTAWKNLKSYDPRLYYDEANGIGMDGWAICVEGELTRRGLPVPY